MERNPKNIERQVGNKALTAPAPAKSDIDFDSIYSWPYMKDVNGYTPDSVIMSKIRQISGMDAAYEEETQKAPVELPENMVKTHQEHVEWFYNQSLTELVPTLERGDIQDNKIKKIDWQLLGESEDNDKNLIDENVEGLGIEK